ncbi:MAG: flavodoxin domain-containing protein [Anaerolineae bacterium]|jgi:flavodoxin
MKAVVAYDSAYGNTEQIAQAIGDALGTKQDVEVVRIGDFGPMLLTGLGLLIVGSPTQRFSPTGPTTAMLKSIPSGGLRGVKVAAFDTRITEAEIERIKILAFFVRLFGYAAEPIATRLQKKSGELLVPPEPFYVGGTEGPLLEGELDRAADWARQIAASLS